MIKEKLMNAKETAADFWRENKGFLYGAGLGLLCIGEGYIIGKNVTLKTMDMGMTMLAMANPKLLDELNVARRNAQEVFGVINRK